MVGIVLQGPPREQRGGRTNNAATTGVRRRLMIDASGLEAVKNGVFMAAEMKNDFLGEVNAYQCEGGDVGLCPVFALATWKMHVDDGIDQVLSSTSRWLMRSSTIPIPFGVRVRDEDSWLTVREASGTMMIQCEIYSAGLSVRTSHCTALARVRVACSAGSCSIQWRTAGSSGVPPQPQ